MLNFLFYHSKKTACVLILLLIAFACKKDEDAPDEDAPPQKKELRTNNPLLTDMDKKVNEILAPYAQQSNAAGLCLGIYKNGQAFYYGYGETAMGNNRIPDSTTIFEIGSITKTYTALLIHEYLQAHSLSINTSVNQLLPADIPTLQYNGKQMLIKHLLNHTSGLPRLPDDLTTGWNPANPYQHYDSNMLYQYLKTFILQKEPGTVFEYSNLGYAILGNILERNTKKNYEQLIVEKIAGPMMLQKTKITLNAADSLNFAIGHNNQGQAVGYWDDFNAFKAAGALRANLCDVMAFGKNILSQQPPTLASAIDSCLNVTFQSSNEIMASAWFYLTVNNTTLLFHDGGTGGFHSYIFINLNNHSILTIVFNNEPDENRNTYINSLLDEIIMK